MKKNYISRLKQYDAKTSLKDKQNLYTKKFINTCYSSLNKENDDPNVCIKKNQSHAKEERKTAKSQQLEQTKETDKKDNNMEEAINEYRSVSQFREININPYECQINKDHDNHVLYVVDGSSKKIICCEECSINYLNKTLLFESQISRNEAEDMQKRLCLTNIKLQCVKLQRYLSERQIEQTEKCKQYYNFLQKQLKNQQVSIIQLISTTYRKSREDISSKIIQIQKLITNIDCGEEHSRSSDRFCRYLNPSSTQVDISIACITLNDEILSKAKQQLSKFDLKNIAFLKIQENHQIEKQQVSKTSKRVGKSVQQSLTCSEDLIDLKATQRINNQLDISFQQNQDFIIGCDYPLIEDTETQQSAISPSFKYF